MQLLEVMELAKYSNEEIADVAFCRFLQCALPGRSLKVLKVYIAGEVAPLPAPPDCSDQRLNHSINDNIEPTPSVDHAISHEARAPATGILPPAFSNVPNPNKVSPVGRFFGTLLATAASKCKQINHLYYMKKKKAIFSSPAITMTTTTMMMTTPTTMTTVVPTMTVTSTLTAMVAPWLLTKNGTVRMPAARKIAKLWGVKLAIDKIVNAGNVEQQAAVLPAVANHPALTAACELARINSLKEQATAKYVCEQSRQMLGCACSSNNAHGKATRDKRHAAKVVPTFTAPSPNRELVIPSQCECTCLIGIAPSMLNHVDNAMIKKREQLPAGVSGIYWTIAKEGKGYLTISNKLKLLLLNTFDILPHVVVLPNTKDTLLMTNTDDKKTLVRKKLMMVGLGTIFLDII